MKPLRYLVVLLMSVGLLVACAKESEDPTPPGVQEPGDDDSIYGTIDFMGDFVFPGDWDSIPTTEVVAFYPGVASWQWLNSSAHGYGASKIAEGDSCASCHVGDALGPKALGERLVAHTGGLEPDPIADKDPWKEVSIQAAYDSTHFYMKAEWESERPGISHEQFRFDGETWTRIGGPKPDVSNNEEKYGGLHSYEDRFSMLLANASIPATDSSAAEFATVGCFQTCHNGMREMGDLEPSSDAVKADPYLGDNGLGEKDVRKYLLITRQTEHQDDADGAWDKPKSEVELGDIFAAGQWLDLWQFRAARGGAVNHASDDHVLDYRFGDHSGSGWEDPDKRGRSAFSSQGASEDGTEMAWMLDAAVVDVSAVPEEKFAEWLSKVPMIENVTAIPYDSSVEFKDGDLLSRRVMRQPEGSAATVEAYSMWEDGKWTLILKRKLNTTYDADKPLVDGETYTVAFGIFDDHASNRRHHVTFQKTLGIGVDADIKAVKID